MPQTALEEAFQKLIDAVARQDERLQWEWDNNGLRITGLTSAAIADVRTRLAEVRQALGEP